MTLPIFLIGPRGCGKTTIGHALARARHYQFTDTDHALQEREQRTVATIVEQEGWARFRELESEALKRPRCRKRWWRPAAALFWRKVTASSCAKTAW
jgi:shikimate kinase